MERTATVVIPGNLRGEGYYGVVGTNYVYTDGKSGRRHATLLTIYIFVVCVNSEDDKAFSVRMSAFISEIKRASATKFCT